MFDWTRYVVNEEEMAKFTRLVIAIQYVKSPKDEHVLSNLKENIQINKIGN